MYVYINTCYCKNNRFPCTTGCCCFVMAIIATQMPRIGGQRSCISGSLLTRHETLAIIKKYYPPIQNVNKHKTPATNQKDTNHEEETPTSTSRHDPQTPDTDHFEKPLQDAPPTPLTRLHPPTRDETPTTNTRQNPPIRATVQKSAINTRHQPIRDMIHQSRHPPIRYINYARRGWISASNYIIGSRLFQIFITNKMFQKDITFWDSK